MTHPARNSVLALVLMGFMVPMAAACKAGEHYDYTPLGERRIFVDSQAPEVEQVRWDGDVLHVELSEPVRIDRFLDAFATKASQLINHSQGERLVALEPPEVLEDALPPEVERLCVGESGRLEITLSELADPLSLATITLDGASTTWTTLDDGRRWQSPILSVGSHDLDLPTTVTDLVGLGLATSRSDTFEVVAGQSTAIFDQPPSGLTPESSLGNPFGFKGLPLDAETGFYYVRHRYYDPELGRFITPDPYGYTDGPSMYPFAMNDPVNYADPMGEYVETAWDALSLSLGALSFRHNVGEGNYGMAALDAFGIVVDTAAILTPLPGGFGALRSGERFWGGVEMARGGAGLIQSVHKIQLVDQSLNIGQGLLQAREEFHRGGLSGYGMGGFYLGMSALGIRGVATSPYQFQSVGAGSNLGNVRIVPRTRVNRIGGGNVDNLRLKPQEAILDPPGISVLLGTTPKGAAQQMKAAFPKATRLHEQAQTVGVSAVEKIREAGFDVVADQTRKFPNHGRLVHPDGVEGFCESNLCKLSSAFEDSPGLRQ